MIRRVKSYVRGLLDDAATRARNTSESDVRLTALAFYAVVQGVLDLVRGY